MWRIRSFPKQRRSRSREEQGEIKARGVLVGILGIVQRLEKFLLLLFPVVVMTLLAQRLAHEYDARFVALLDLRGTPFR